MSYLTDVNGERQRLYGDDLTFREWHRFPTLPAYCSMIDIDIVEYCKDCRQPLALIETAIDVGQLFKPTTVTKNLAVLAGIPAYLILYKIAVKNQSIGDCRVKKIYPPESNFRLLEPEEVKELIIQIHQNCFCGGEDG